MTDPVTDPPLVHIGYVKTATTYLQRHLFRAEDQGFALAGGALSRGHIVSGLIVCDDYSFDATAQAARFAELEAPQRAAGLLPVWSEEVLLGDPIAGRYDGARNLEKLAATLPQARILITIREQKAMALSIYREYIKQGGTAPLRDVIGTGQEAPAFRPHLREEVLQFDRAVRFVQGLFGADQVLVLPQEMLQRDPGAYFAHLGRFLGREIAVPAAAGGDNRGRGAVAMGLNRRLNHLVRRSPLSRDVGLGWALKDKLVSGVNRLTPPALTARAEAALKAQIAARYDGVFDAGNQRLAALTGLPLADYGYAGAG